MDNWIDVRERLPLNQGAYLVMNCENGDVSIANFAFNLHDQITALFEFYLGDRVHDEQVPAMPGWYNWNYGDYWIETVTHWMPLPEPPKPEPTYPTWEQFIRHMLLINQPDIVGPIPTDMDILDFIKYTRIPADFAKKLEIEPVKED